MIFIIMDPCYLEWRCWGPAPPTLTFSRPMQGPEAKHCKRQSKPGELPWFPRLIEQTGQDFILRDSNMASLLKQLKIRENVGKGDVHQSIFWLCPILFFHFILSILKKQCLSLIKQCPCVIAKRLQLLTLRHDVLSKSEGTVPWR